MATAPQPGRQLPVRLRVRRLASPRLILGARFIPAHNLEHRHSGIGLLTPADVHHGRAELVRARRAEVLSAAYAQHPERFVGKPSEPPALPTAVWINQPKEDTTTTQ
jgi:putative transposase